jgi:hypothetical protein
LHPEDPSSSSRERFEPEKDGDMDEDIFASSEMLLGWISRRIDAISGMQHDLAYERVLLQEQATRLRLGWSVADARLALRQGGVMIRPAWSPREREARIVGAA